MTRIEKNSGIVNMGGNNHLHGNVVGDGATVHNLGHTEPRTVISAEDPRKQWDIGVVTILAEEARAIQDELGLTPEPGKVGGLFFSTGEIDAGGGTVKVVATRTHTQGQRSAMAACEHLRRHYDPTVLALVGVGGGIHEDKDYAGIGDVVVATRVVYYDLRKEMPEGTVRRGEERESPAEIVHSVNAYFTEHGEPAEFPGQADGFRERTFHALPSPIGSGDAVVADAESRIRHWLTGYNDKILAVDMEAGGLSQFWQENSVDPDRNPGWVVVRGISDRADQDKGHNYHELAARNAAFVLRGLLPYLR